MNQQINQLIIHLDFTEKKETLNFEEALSESIDQVLAALGVDQAVYSFLEQEEGIGKEQIPKKIQKFTDALESIFGISAAVVELKIIEKLNWQTHGFTYKSKSQDLFFVDYLAALQKHLK
jgi:hypothetical protein